MINRLVIFCIILFAATNLMNGMLIQSLADVSAAYALQCESCEKAKPFFVIAAIANLYKMRFLGVFGFLFAATGRMDIAEKLLGMHYALVGIDDENAAPIGRVAAGVAGVSLAL